MSKFILLQVAAVLTLCAACVAATDYCNPNLCPTSASHIGCGNLGGFGKKCGANAKLVPINAELRQFILSKLNGYRNKIASGHFGNFNAAHRMATLQWDSELATLAEYSVKQCQDVRQSCRNTATFKHVGQIFGRIVFRAGKYRQKRVLALKFNEWFNEHKTATKMHLKKLNREQSASIASFTQLVEERSTHVGCGILSERKGNWIQQNIICLFARENFFNQPVYRSSQVAASGCQTGAHPMYRNLCSEHEIYDVNVVDDFADDEFKPIIRFKFISQP